MTAPGRTTARMGALTLTLEAFVVFFATLVATRLSDLDPTVAWWGGGVIALACLLACGVVRRTGGMAVGSALQLVVLATGFVVPAMWGMGALFVAMWVWLAGIGARIDRDHAAHRSA